MKRILSLVFLLLNLAFLGLSCNLRTCQKEKDTAVGSHQAESAKTEGAGDKKTPVEDIKGVNFIGLSDAQKQGLAKLLNDEVCPCGCPKTIAECLKLEKPCAHGQILAAWAADQLRLGAPERMLFPAISEEINKGYLIKPITFDESLGTTKGKKDARYVLAEFADFECPLCKHSASQLKSFYEENKDTVRVVFFHFPLTIHQNAVKAAIAAEAAKLQGKFWEMHDELFAHQGPLTDDAIKSIAESLFKGAALTKFMKDLNSKALLERVQSQRAYAEDSLKLMATPSIFLNGRPVYLPFMKQSFEVMLKLEDSRTENCAAK